MRVSGAYAWLAAIAACGLAGLGVFSGVVSLLRTLALVALTSLACFALSRANLLCWHRGRMRPFASPAASIDGRQFRLPMFLPVFGLAVVGWVFFMLAWTSLGMTVVMSVARRFGCAFPALVFAAFSVGIVLASWGVAFRSATRRELTGAAVLALGVVLAAIRLIPW